jgi:N,N'-diacetyllegionaminate synthase
MTYIDKWKTYVIAEAGSCGDAQLDKMLCQIDDAKYVDADAVKFQWTSNAGLMALQRGTALQNGYVDVYGKYLQWPVEWHERFARACKDIGLDYLCTVYLSDDIATVAPYVARFKVASFEAIDCSFIQAHREFVTKKRDLLISTGMCSAKDLEFLMRTCICPSGLVPYVKLLHCVSSYPSPLNQLNLSAIRSSGENWQMQGYSDHSLPTLTQTGALAVAAGATIVEAHLRHAQTANDNPDREHAMTKEQFLDYMTQLREAEQAIGSSIKEAQPCEKKMKQYRVRS